MRYLASFWVTAILCAGVACVFVGGSYLGSYHPLGLAALVAAVIFGVVWRGIHVTMQADR